MAAEPVAERMENFRAEGELPGDVSLKIGRAVKRTSGGKEQVLMLAEINDGAEVEGDIVAAAGGHRGVIIDFSAERNVFGDLPLHEYAAEAPVLIAGAGVDAITAAAVNRPVAKTFLQP